MQFSVIYLETWGSTQPLCVALLTLVFCFCFFVFLVGHTQHQVLLYCMSQCLMYLKSSLFSWLVGGACLLWLVVCGQGTLSTSHIRSFTNVSLNCECDNLEPQEARIIKLLRMVRSRGKKNSFFTYFQVHLLIE